MAAVSSQAGLTKECWGNTLHALTMVEEEEKKKCAFEVN